MSCEIVTTRSGARAVRDLATGELMHPVIGPIVEARELYVRPSRLEARLRDASSNANDPLVLLDVGLGAGSNAIAAWRLSESLPASARRLDIVSFERSLDAMRLALQSENREAFAFDGPAGDAGRAILEHGAYETARTRWRLVQGDLPDTLAPEPAASADVVFWDPFSPRANASLWTMTAFASLRRLCRDGATVHTYSSATATRSAMLLAGFAVGVGELTTDGKPTTECAVLARDVARPLGRRWVERLARSSAPFPADAPPDALDRIRALAQFATASG